MGKGLGKLLTDLLHPANHGGVIHPMMTFNGSKSHLVDVGMQALTLNLIAISLGRITFDKLATTVFALVALFTGLITIFTVIRGVTSGTLHGGVLKAYSLITLENHLPIQQHPALKAISVS